MTEKEKMLAGLTYNATDPALIDELNANKLRIQQYNAIDPTNVDARTNAIRSILGSAGENPIVLQPFFCDYGSNISVGDRFFANFNLTILDEAHVTIGNDVFIGPNVGIYTACHSTNPTERNSRREWAEPVRIGNNVWIGGSVTICPGVRIGNNTTIGAGSVVVHNIPDNSIAVGNPAKVIKKVENQET